MPLPTLTFDEIDDLLYFARANEKSDLERGILDLSQKYGCEPGEILEACIDPESGNTVLHFCSANGYIDLLPQLLSQLKGGEIVGQATSKIVNQGNREGNTPLHWAAYNGHLEIVKILIGQGADMWIKNKAGHLAMFEAERAEKNEVVQFLLEAGGREVERAGSERTTTTEDLDSDPMEGSSTGTQTAELDDGTDGDANATGQLSIG